MKTTINLKDELYKKLMKETVERYGNTKNLSRLINEKLAMVQSSPDRNDSNEIKKKLKILHECAGSWKIKETGSEYVRNIRKGWAKRLEKMDI